MTDGVDDGSTTAMGMRTRDTVLDTETFLRRPKRPPNCHHGRDFTVLAERGVAAMFLNVVVAGVPSHTRSGRKDRTGRGMAGVACDKRNERLWQKPNSVDPCAGGAARGWALISRIESENTEVASIQLGRFRSVSPE